MCAHLTAVPHRAIVKGARAVCVRAAERQRPGGIARRRTRGPARPKLPRIDSPTAQMYEKYYVTSLRRRALRLALRSMNTSKGQFVVENCLATAEQEHH